MASYHPDILDALPHRPPFRFVSKVLDLQSERQGEAVWQVTGDEPFFEGHFPKTPIVPGVLITEALAQLSGLVALPGDGVAAAANANAGRLAHVEVRFRDAVSPPAEIHLTSRMSQVFGQLRQFDVEARCRDERIATGKLTLALPGVGPEGER